MAMTEIPVVGRTALEVQGESVVVAGFTLDEMNAIRALTGPRGQWAVLEIFARKIETPADALERGMLWLALVLQAWMVSVQAIIDALQQQPMNRAARRHAN